MLECEQNLGRFFESKTISELFEQRSNFPRIFRAIANERTERKIASESNLHYQMNFQKKMAAPEGVKSKDIIQKIYKHLEFLPSNMG